jgi:hypothetical protein
MNTYEQLDAWIDAHFDEQVRFLQELIRVPTDTPPGNNAPHADRAADLLRAMGWTSKSTRCPKPKCVPPAWKASPTWWSAARMAPENPCC